MRKLFLMIGMMSLAVATGCDSGPNDTTDAGVTLPGEDGATANACGDPGGPYGVSLDSNLEGFTLSGVSRETTSSEFVEGPWSFYPDNFCDYEVTIIAMAAGWCGPCKAEAPELEQLYQDYTAAGHNIRVIELYVQDAQYGAPDRADAEGWARDYGLTIPVLIDVENLAFEYFSMVSFPGVLAIDSSGRIRFRENGYRMGLPSLRAAVDAIIAE